MAIVEKISIEGIPEAIELLKKLGDSGAADFVELGAAAELAAGQVGDAGDAIAKIASLQAGGGSSVIAPASVSGGAADPSNELAQAINNLAAASEDSGGEDKVLDIAKSPVAPERTPAATAARDRESISDKAFDVADSGEAPTELEHAVTAAAPAIAERVETKLVSAQPQQQPAAPAPPPLPTPLTAPVPVTIAPAPGAPPVAAGPAAAAAPPPLATPPVHPIPVTLAPTPGAPPSASVAPAAALASAATHAPAPAAPGHVAGGLSHELEEAAERAEKARERLKQLGEVGASAMEGTRGAVERLSEALEGLSAGGTLSVLEDIAKGMGGVVSSLGPVGEVAGVAATALLALTGAVAGTALAGSKLSSAASADALAMDDIAKTSGNTIEEVQALKTAFGDAGADADQLAHSMKQLAVRAEVEWPAIATSIRDNADKMKTDQTGIRDASSKVEESMSAEREAALKTADAQDKVAAAHEHVETSVYDVKDAQLNLLKAQQAQEVASSGKPSSALAGEIKEAETEATDRAVRRAELAVQDKQREAAAAPRQEQQASLDLASAKRAQDTAPDKLTAAIVALHGAINKMHDDTISSPKSVSEQLQGQRSDIDLKSVSRQTLFQAGLINAGQGADAISQIAAMADIYKQLPEGKKFGFGTEAFGRGFQQNTMGRVLEQGGDFVRDNAAKPNEFGKLIQGQIAPALEARKAESTASEEGEIAKFRVGAEGLKQYADMLHSFAEQLKSNPAIFESFGRTLGAAMDEVGNNAGLATKALNALAVSLGAVAGTNIAPKPTTEPTKPQTELAPGRTPQQIADYDAAERRRNLSSNSPETRRGDALSKLASGGHVEPGFEAGVSSPNEIREAETDAKAKAGLAAQMAADAADDVERPGGMKVVHTPRAHEAAPAVEHGEGHEPAHKAEHEAEPPPPVDTANRRENPFFRAQPHEPAAAERAPALPHEGGVPSSQESESFPSSGGAEMAGAGFAGQIGPALATFSAVIKSLKDAITPEAAKADPASLKTQAEALDQAATKTADAGKAQADAAEKTSQGAAATDVAARDLVIAANALMPKDDDDKEKNKTGGGSGGGGAGASASGSGGGATASVSSQGGGTASSGGSAAAATPPDAAAAYDSALWAEPPKAAFDNSNDGGTLLTPGELGGPGVTVGDTPPPAPPAPPAPVEAAAAEPAVASPQIAPRGLPRPPHSETEYPVTEDASTPYPGGRSPTHTHEAAAASGAASFETPEVVTSRDRVEKGIATPRDLSNVAAADADETLAAPLPEPRPQTVPVGSGVPDHFAVPSANADGDQALSERIGGGEDRQPGGARLAAPVGAGVPEEHFATPGSPRAPNTQDEVPIGKLLGGDHSSVVPEAIGNRNAPGNEGRPFVATNTQDIQNRRDLLHDYAPGLSEQQRNAVAGAPGLHVDMDDKRTRVGYGPSAEVAHEQTQSDAVQKQRQDEADRHRIALQRAENKGTANQPGWYDANRNLRQQEAATAGALHKQGEIEYGADFASSTKEAEELERRRRRELLEGRYYAEGGAVVAKQHLDDVNADRFAEGGFVRKTEPFVANPESSIAMHGAPKTDGGLIVGPGTGTSDSVPINASHGEYVVKAERVKQVGVDWMHDFNAGRGFSISGLVPEPPRFALGGLVGMTPRTPGFKDGGLVDSGAGPALHPVPLYIGGDKVATLLGAPSAVEDIAKFAMTSQSTSIGTTNPSWFS